MLVQATAPETSEGVRLDRCRRLVSLYRGPYLDGCYFDWVEPIRTRLERQVHDLLLKLGRWALEKQRLTEAIEYASRLFELDPCHQEACSQAMQANLALGRPEEAVRLFRRCKQQLASELSIEPVTSLLELHQRALLML